MPKFEQSTRKPNNNGVENFRKMLRAMSVHEWELWPIDKSCKLAKM